MPIACTGETTSAIRGTAMAPSPEKPPLDRPSAVTAGMATR